MKKKKPEIQKLFSEAIRRCRLKHYQNGKFIGYSLWYEEDKATHEQIGRQIEVVEVEINSLLRALKIVKRKDERRKPQPQRSEVNNGT